MGANIKNTDFVELFAAEPFVQAYVEAHQDAKLARHAPQASRRPEEQVGSSYVPMVCLALLVAGYIYLKLH